MLNVARHLILLLALAAVGVVQVLGASSGYLCNHYSKIQQTAAGHCHKAFGLEAASAGADGNYAKCSQSSESGCSKDGRENHVPATVELQSRSMTGEFVSVPQYAPLLLADLQCHEAIIIQVQQTIASLGLKYAIEDAPHVQALVVAKISVLLI